MLKIKLARFGKKGQPHYRIVVTEARSKRDGQYTALLGHYAPTMTPKILDLDVKAYGEWLVKGAQPTPTVAGLFDRVSSGNPFPVKKARPSKKSIKKAKSDAAAAEEAKNAPAPVAEPAGEPEVVAETQPEAPAEATTEETPATE